MLASENDDCIKSVLSEWDQLTLWTIIPFYKFRQVFATLDLKLQSILCLLFGITWASLKEYRTQTRKMKHEGLLYIDGGSDASL